MHAKPDLRVVLEWKIIRSGSVIADVMWLLRMMEISDTREHHFKFKHLLVSMALEDPSRFISKFAAPDATEYLSMLWQAVGAELRDSEPIAPEGIAVRKHQLDTEPDAVYVTLPPAVGRNEALFIAVVRPKDADSDTFVFALERSLNPIAQEPSTMLLGFSRQSRCNFGPADANPTLDDFINRVDELREQSAT